MSQPSRAPITIALVDDYDVVVKGVANMLEPYRDRVVIAELDSTMSVKDAVDIVLYDSFAQPESDHEEIGVLVANHGAHGYLSKTLPARELVAALEAVHAGEVVVSEATGRARGAPGQDWPGRSEGLSEREAEILALITQGKSNADVARLTYLSPNTVKSYIRTIYRKLGVDSRTRAVLWGVQHGFTPDHHRIEHWRGGP
jgi:DNA-binding CsgD family transcriptional regulator